jgi:hypothetical protein
MTPIVQVYTPKIFEDGLHIYANREGLTKLQKLVNGLLQHEFSTGSFYCRNINNEAYEITITSSESIDNEKLPSITDEELSEEEMNLLHKFNEDYL